MNRKKIDTWYQVSNSNLGAEILIYGYIGPWDEVDFVGFQSQLRELALVNRTCTVRIHSGGGSVFDGLAIFDALRNSGMQITTLVEGMAASMAGVIAQAADKGKRQMYENATLMIHKVQGSAYGNVDDIRSYADMVEEREARLKEIFVKATGQTVATVDSWFAKNTDWWINANDALKLGLVDSLLKPDDDTESIPDTLYNKGEKAVYEHLVNKVIKSENSNNHMKLNVLVSAALAARGVSQLENATDEQLHTAVLNAFKKADEKVTELQNQLEAVKKNNAEALVNSAVALGKIKEEEKADYVELAVQNFALAEKTLAKIQGMPKQEGKQAPQNVVVNVGLTDSGKSIDPNDRENWSFEDWRKKDSKGLQNLQETDPEKYQELFNKAYKS